MAEPTSDSEAEPILLFHNALTADNYKRVYALLAEGADVNHSFRSEHLYKCPLHICCHNGNIETLKVLIHWKADLDCADRYDQRPLHYSVMKRQYEIVKLLLEKGADVNAQNIAGQSPLFYAVTSEDVVILKILLDHGASLKIREVTGRTPLHAAVGHDWLLEQMLEQKDVDVDLLDDSKNTPLQLAVMSGGVNSVQALLVAKADPDIPDDQGMTPLLNAILSFRLTLVNKERHFEKTEWLVKFGADVNKVNPTTGQAPLHLLVASKQNFEHLGPLLIKFGADINQRDNHGCTPLILALLAGNKQAVRLLLRYNCDTSSVGKVYIMNNVTQVNALDICLTHKLIDMFRLLLETGAKLDCAKYFEKIFGDPTYLTNLHRLRHILKFHLTHVSPLKRLCRTRIRSTCGPRPEDWISQLGLPKYLMRYVLLENELLEE